MSAPSVTAPAAFPRESGLTQRLAALALPLVLAGYFLLALAYSLATPLLQESDESRHLAYVNHLLTNRELPLLARAMHGDPGERFQPPLYYVTVAGLLVATNGGPLDFPLEGNAPRLIRLPVVVVSSDARAFHLLRAAQIVFGLLTVYFTYRLAALALDRRAALAAAMIVAGLPLFAHISSVLNNDNLANCLSALALFLLLKTWLEGHPGFGRASAIGVILGVALLTKVTTAFLVPAAVGVLAFSARNRSRRWTLPVWTLVVAGAVGAWFPLSVANVCGKPCIPGLSISGTALLLDWNSWKRAVGSFSGYFGWMSFPLDGASRVALTLLWAAGVGLALWAIAQRRAPRSVRFLAGATALAVAQFVFFFWSYGLWHARYLFGALPALATLWAFGLNGLFGRASHLLPMLVLALAALNVQVLIRLWPR